MDRVPHLLTLVSLAVFGTFLSNLLQGQSGCEMLSNALFGAVFATVICAGFFRWKGLPLGISTGEYRRLRNEVYRVPLDDDTASS
ncbi:hypothetical protein [Bradyrhizobium sp. CCGUVB14]|uniref:hypothetical protein n=1 Tax=Bradyrhizobium sp. CCGUVB14 TaxID=2949628 RepID=UPI0020B18DB7|nr:hypothetical protein [Bradyrhizobium sp. CCGUVB14]MCP3446543.1 hypothetical protein [Bradyrhizobium sp. CCGUVB14]